MLKLTTSNPTYKVIAISAFTLFFGSAALQPAFAESKAKDMVTEAPADMDFKKLDVNSDKKLSLKEAVKDRALANSFDATDANKDGVITPDEYASYKAGMQAKSPDSAGSATTGSASSAAPTTPPPAN